MNDIAAERRHRRSLRRHKGKDTVALAGSRFPAEIDRDRILYSSEFRRLAGVTQVTAARERHLVHNRLTHSLKVAQMGRRIAERLIRKTPRADDLNLIPEVVEVAGLAHDIGHPPFGHAAEREIQKIFREDLGEEYGFEGNAQSFRIITKLSWRKTEFMGLDLSRASLRAILKYPQYRKPDAAPPFYDRSRGAKWGAYASDKKDFEFALDAPMPPAGVRCSNSLIMDWADDISFATHDLEDFIQAGVIQPATIDAPKFREYATASMAKLEGFEGDEFEAAFDSVNASLINIVGSTYDGSRNDRVKLHRFISGKIRDFDQACRLQNLELIVDRHAQYQVEILKKLTDFSVVNNASVAATEFGQRRVIASLHSSIQNLLRFQSEHSLPVHLRDLYELVARENDNYVNDSVRYRTAADYICTLTEAQAVDLANRLTGANWDSALGAWLQ